MTKVSDNTVAFLLPDQDYIWPSILNYMIRLYIKVLKYLTIIMFNNTFRLKVVPLLAFRPLLFLLLLLMLRTNVFKFGFSVQDIGSHLVFSLDIQHQFDDPHRA